MVQELTEVRAEGGLELDRLARRLRWLFGHLKQLRTPVRLVFVAVSSEFGLTLRFCFKDFGIPRNRFYENSHSFSSDASAHAGVLFPGPSESGSR
jgi:hypothetical protein